VDEEYKEIFVLSDFAVKHGRESFLFTETVGTNGREEYDEPRWTNETPSGKEEESLLMLFRKEVKDDLLTDKTLDKGKRNDPELSEIAIEHK
jgi:hypothetical protein